jgi:hypothetical protein
MKSAPTVSGEQEGTGYDHKYSVELARATSYIANAADTDLALQAMGEIFCEVAYAHGNDGLLIFRKLLAERLEKSGYPAAALAVRQSA